MDARRYEPEDFIVALLAKLQEQKRNRFEANAVKIHPIFFQWRGIPDYEKFFTQFTFDTRDYFPFSETLEEVLDSLQFAGYLERTNPLGTWYQISPALQKVFQREVRSHFDEEDLAAISELAMRFAESVKTQER